MRHPLRGKRCATPGVFRFALYTLHEIKQSVGCNERSELHRQIARCVLLRNTGDFCDCVIAAGPVGRVKPLLHITMKSGKGPIGDLFYIAMVLRIDMHIVDMCAPILFISDQMFPVTTLPDIALLTSVAVVIPWSQTGRCRLKKLLIRRQRVG